MQFFKFPCCVLSDHSCQLVVVTSASLFLLLDNLRESQKVLSRRLVAEALFYRRDCDTDFFQFKQCHMAESLILELKAHTSQSRLLSGFFDISSFNSSLFRPFIRQGSALTISVKL